MCAVDEVQCIGVLDKLTTSQQTVIILFNFKLLKFKLDFVKVKICLCLLLILKRVESFLHKDVSFVVTESQESLKEDCSDVKGEVKGTIEGTQRPTKQLESVLSNERHRPVTPRPAVLNITCFFVFFYFFKLPKVLVLSNIIKYNKT